MVHPIRDRVCTLGAQIDALSMDQVLNLLEGWGQHRISKVVCMCNVHVLVTARRDERLMEVVNGADLVTPDGAPIAWLMRRYGRENQQRVAGPDVMWAYCRRAQASGQGVYLFGGRSEVLFLLCNRLTNAFPGLHIVGSESPPFGEWSDEEEAAMIQRINTSGASVVFVGLGCPKQENWMWRNRSRVEGVMVGVGAAFDFHAGTKSRAPTWMCRCGLEWLHRFAAEPRRLWRRYLVTNSIFLFYVVAAMVRRTVTRKD